MLKKSNKGALFAGKKTTCIKHVVMFVLCSRGNEGMHQAGQHPQGRFG